MLLYPHSYAGLPLLLTVAGSAIPRAIVPALYSFFLCLAIEESVSNETLNHLFSHPYPYTVFANLVGFALVFRTNIAYNRYWEGISHLKQMSAKWGDAAFHVLSMDCHHKPPPGDAAEGAHTLTSTRDHFFAAACHRFSLMHALACAHLRREVSLRDFVPAVIPMARRASRRPIKATARRIGGCEALLRAFWPSKYDEFIVSNPLPVLGGVTDEERETLDLINSEARVAAELARVLGTLNTRRAAGGLNVDPPAVSRIHQTLSDGNAAFFQACKLEDTPLPFPYAQMVSLVLFIFATTYPMLAAAKASGYDGTHAEWLAPVLSFVVVLSYFGLHEVTPAAATPRTEATARTPRERRANAARTPRERRANAARTPRERQVARELEDPFIHPPNEAPFVAMQKSFNTRLLTCWDSLDRMYADERVPYGMGGLGLRAVTKTGAESLLEAMGHRLSSARGDCSTESLRSGVTQPPAPSPSGRRSTRARVEQCGDGVSLQEGTPTSDGGASPSISRSTSATRWQRAGKKLQHVQAVS